MNSIVTAVCIAFLAGVGAAGEDKPQEPRGCAFRGNSYAVGERWATGPPDKCAKYLCEDDDQIAALTCPLFVPAPGCTVSPGDEDAVYPGCCPLRKCHHAVEDAVKPTARSAVRFSLGTAKTATTTETAKTVTTTETSTEAATETITVASEATTETVAESVTEVMTVATTEGTTPDFIPVTSTMVPP